MSQNNSLPPFIRDGLELSARSARQTKRAAAHVSRSPLAIAGVIALALAAWLASGAIEREPAPAEVAVETAPPERFAVETRWSQATEVERYVTVQAVVEAERILTVRSEASGQVAELPVARGGQVTEGDVIARISVDDRQARLDQANAQLAQAEQEHSAATRLAERGYASEARVRTAFAQLEAARAGVRVAQEAVANLTILAPFSGVLDTIDVELGEYVAVGGEIGRLVDADPLIAEARVAQQDVRRIRVGAQARVNLVTGEERTGEVRYVASNAEAATRTFLVEIVVANADGAAPSGVSAQVSIPTGVAPAHFVSPAILALDSEGVLGVKTVDEEDRVHFEPVEIVRAEADGLWISGLPERARLITTGQGFVGDGQLVQPVERDPDEAAASPLAGAAPGAPSSIPG